MPKAITPKVTAVKAYANCDDTYVVWQTNGIISQCLGFALYRLRKGALMPEIVSTWVGFEDETPPLGTREPSTVWPIQKYMWSDYLAREGDTVAYRVVPMCGKDKESLTEVQDLAGESTPVTVGPPSGPFSAHFNRGIVMSQWIERRLGKFPIGKQPRALKDLIADPSDKTRMFLAGELREQLLSLLDGCKKERGRLYAALFELNDPELLEAITALGERAHVVLSNGAHSGRDQDENADYRPKLREAGIEVFDRMLASGHLGHNKFAVFCNTKGDPETVWTGSTNWTKTGLCTQANNGILIADREIAKSFRDQWELLKESGDDMPPALFDSNSAPKSHKVGKASATLWFAPVRNRVDLDFAANLIDAARDGILFLMFNPGPKDSLLNVILSKRAAQKDLYVHGVVNQDPSTSKTPVVDLFHRGQHERAPLDVVLPEGVDERLAFWNQEISRGQFLSQIGHAMVHSKVIVVDPFSKHPIVMTGSHNLGPRASGSNDENLVIVENDDGLAAAYAVNIMSIYNQYRWRFQNWGHAKNAPPGALYRSGWHGLKNDDTWQQHYMSDACQQELAFWIGTSSERRGSSSSIKKSGRSRLMIAGGGSVAPGQPGKPPPDPPGIHGPVRPGGGSRPPEDRDQPHGPHEPTRPGGPPEEKPKPVEGGKDKGKGKGKDKK